MLSTSLYEYRLFDNLVHFCRVIDDVVHVEWCTENGTMQKSQHELANGFNCGNREDVEIMNFYR